MSGSTKKELILIPKSENYIQYMIEIIMKLPRTERFSLGNEYKNVMYTMYENIMFINREVDLKERIRILNKVDTYMNIQRSYLRIMCKYNWIDKRRFDYIIGMLSEMGKIVGGLIKYYAQKS